MDGQVIIHEQINTTNMSTSYEVRYTTNPTDFKSYDTDRLRNDFLIPSLFEEGKVNWVYTHYDRYMAGAAVPTEEPLLLESIDPLKADFFLERRELGIINIGHTGTVTVDGTSYELATKEALYVGMNCKEVQFSSNTPSQPARFYLNSAPAHQAFPTKHISQAEAEVVELGSLETSNARTIRKLIVNSILKTNQVQMGMTE